MTFQVNTIATEDTVIIHLDQPEAKGVVVLRRTAYGLAVSANGIDLGLIDLFAFAKTPEDATVKFNFGRATTGGVIVYEGNDRLEVRVEDTDFSNSGWDGCFAIAIDEIEPEEETA